MTKALKLPQSQGFASTLRLVDPSKVTDGDKAMTEDYALMTAPTPFDDGTSYKWAEVREILGLNSNVANARWLPEKLMPLLQNLKTPELLTEKGRPTKFCAQMLFRYKCFVIEAGNDYETFCNLVRTAFPSNVPTALAVVVSDDDENGDEPLSPKSSLSLMRDRIEDNNDNLESRIVLALQTGQEAKRAESEYKQLKEKSWEQQVIEDEIALYQEEQDRKKKEFELRAKVRQMLERSGEE